VGIAAARLPALPSFPALPGTAGTASLPGSGAVRAGSLLAEGAGEGFEAFLGKIGQLGLSLTGSWQVKCFGLRKKFWVHLPRKGERMCD